MTFCLLVLGMFQVLLSFFIGSLLVGRTPEELEMLERRVKQQCEAGLRAEYLSATDLRIKEPELMVDKDTGAAFLPDDSQLDARRAVEFLEKVFFFVSCNLVLVRVTRFVLLVLNSRIPTHQLVTLALLVN